MTDIIIRRYKDGDENQIVELIKQGFNPEINPKIDLTIWKWKYKENPAPTRAVIWVAEDKDRNKIIGHYAINPMIMKWKDKEIIGSQVSGIVTHKNYRRRGIFKALAINSSDDAGKEGIPVTYVFPNPNSYNLFKKIGWSHIFSLTKMLKVLNIKALSRKYSSNAIKRKIIEASLHTYYTYMLFKSSSFRRISHPENITIFEVKRFDRSFDDLWTRISKYYEYIVKRDAKYLNWRYSHPYENFKIFASKENNNIAGYVILKCKILPDIKIGYIFDLFCNPNDKSMIRSLISKSIEYFVRRKMDIIHFCVLKEHPYYRICKEFGFLKKEEIPFVLHINTHGFKNAEEFKDPRKWLLSYGDREGSF